jgi:hypothetical protein
MPGSLSQTVRAIHCPCRSLALVVGDCTALHAHLIRKLFQKGSGLDPAAGFFFFFFFLSFDTLSKRFDFHASSHPFQYR